MTDETALPAAGGTDQPEPAGTLTLHTDLLGDLQVSGSAARAAELEALASRAALTAYGVRVLW